MCSRRRQVTGLLQEHKQGPSCLCRTTSFMHPLLPCRLCSQLTGLHFIMYSSTWFYSNKSHKPTPLVSVIVHTTLHKQTPATRRALLPASQSPDHPHIIGRRPNPSYPNTAPSHHTHYTLIHCYTVIVISPVIPVHPTNPFNSPHPIIAKPMTKLLTTMYSYRFQTMYVRYQ